ncbi:MAG: methyltransferase regulatory domain-containing protein [Reyranella sp.]|nr:methyltransferase regulatory domain-containing protein [Reyranella sp.]
MNDRTEGYVTDLGYIYGYYPELNPLRHRLAFLTAGLRPQAIATACELGFGQGVSLAIHAAAASTRWYGADINPDHVAFARGLLAASGVEAGLHADTFAEFANRGDLPDFDYIGLHGVWSWVSDRNRAAIVDFVRRKLKAGGVVYMGYNALPGLAAFSPLRHLLIEHAEAARVTGRSIAERIDGALAFADRLLATKPAYARDDRQSLDRFEGLKKEDRRYLAHEYFNRDWVPMHFATVARRLAPAGLSYACSASFADSLDTLSLSDEQRSLLDGVGDPLLRQSARDLIFNESFRRDYWVRGAARLSGPERIEALRGERVIAVTSLPNLPFKIRAALALSRATPGEAVHTPILEFLADHRPKALGKIEQAVASKGITLMQIVDAVTLMASCDYLEAAQDDAATAAARQRTDRLNTHVVDATLAGGEVRTLASPVTGGGVHVRRVAQVFLSALRRGKTRPEEWVHEAAKTLAADGTPETSLADLTAQAEIFARETLPTLRALQVV